MSEKDTIAIYVGPYVIKVENNLKALTLIAEEMEEALEVIQDAIGEFD